MNDEGEEEQEERKGAPIPINHDYINGMHPWYLDGLRAILSLSHDQDSERDVSQDKEKKPDPHSMPPRSQCW